MASSPRRAVMIFAVAPFYLVGAGLAGIGGALLAWHLMPRLGDNLAQPVIDFAFPIFGFLAGCAIGLALLVLLTLPLARRLRTPRVNRL